jgi:hemolysin III
MKETARIAGERGTGEVAAGVVQIIGGACALTGLPFLFLTGKRELGGASLAAFLLYGLCLLAWFTLSAIAHLLSRPPARLVLASFEDALSFALIAASYTPFCLLSFHGPLGFLVLALLWVFAALATLAILLGGGRAREALVAAYYLVFTLGLPLVPPLRALLPVAVFPWLLLAGGLFAFSLLYRTRSSMPYHHALWHAFVLSASVILFFAVGSLVRA